MTRAVGRASTLDRESRTVEVIALSGLAPALRPPPAPDGSRSRWIEELGADGADLTSFDGAPALTDHVNRVSASVGSVASVRVDGDRILATVRFDGSPEADSLMGKIEAGSVRGVSLGYGVRRYERVGNRDGFPVFRAAAWRPNELSFTPLGIDPGAQVRAMEAHMTDTTTTPDTTPADTATYEAPAENLNRADVHRELRSIGRLAGMDQAAVDDMIDRGVTPDEARRAAFEHMAKRSAPPVNNRSQRVEVGTDYTDPDLIRRAMADALASTFTPLCKAEGMAQQYRAYRPLDMAGELLAARGERISRFDRETILTRSVGAHTSSDFPLLLADAANKSLLAQYSAAAPTYRMIAARRPFNDFKQHKFLRLGDFPDFAEVSEAGEGTYGTISENRETVIPKEYATGLAIGRKALINDDLSALSDFASLIAIRAAAFEDATVYALIAADGPTLSDGVALFNNASHGNKAGSGAAISVTTLAAAVQALREMTGLDGIKLNITPRYLVVGPAYELIARQTLATITPTKAGDVNPFAGTLELIVDANISGNRWFVAADPAQVPTLVYGYVNGAEGPQITTETDFDTKSVKVRAGLDFAAGAIDYRGLYLNTGG
ncbi:MAG: peptidase [Alphaproteobacteria bacterium]|nr:peptidase [Alphaproteobacteria bacterium]